MTVRLIATVPIEANAVLPLTGERRSGYRTLHERAEMRGPILHSSEA